MGQCRAKKKEKENTILWRADNKAKGIVYRKRFDYAKTYIKAAKLVANMNRRSMSTM